MFGDGSVRFLNNSLPCDPSDSWLNFPTVNSVTYVGQRLELPNDGQPVNIPGSGSGQGRSHVRPPLDSSLRTWGNYTMMGFDFAAWRVPRWRSCWPS